MSPQAIHTRMYDKLPAWEARWRGIPLIPAHGIHGGNGHRIWTPKDNYECCNKQPTASYSMLNTQQSKKEGQIGKLNWLCPVSHTQYKTKFHGSELCRTQRHSFSVSYVIAFARMTGHDLDLSCFPRINLKPSLEYVWITISYLSLCLLQRWITISDFSLRFQAWLRIDPACTVVK